MHSCLDPLLGPAAGSVVVLGDGTVMAVSWQQPTMLRDGSVMAVAHYGSFMAVAHYGSVMAARARVGRTGIRYHVVGHNGPQSSSLTPVIIMLQHTSAPTAAPRAVGGIVALCGPATDTEASCLASLA